MKETLAMVSEVIWNKTPYAIGMKTEPQNDKIEYFTHEVKNRLKCAIPCCSAHVFLSYALTFLQEAFVGLSQHLGQQATPQGHIFSYWELCVNDLTAYLVSLHPISLTRFQLPGR